MHGLCARQFGDALPGHIEDGDIQAGNGRGAGADQGVLGGAHLHEVRKTPAVPAKLQMGVPSGVLQHVGKDVQGAPPGQFRQLQPSLLKRLHQVGAGHRRGRRSDQPLDALPEGGAAGAKLLRIAAHMAGQLGRQVIAVPHLLATVLGAFEGQFGIAVGLAQAVQKLARRTGIARQGEDPQFGVGLQVQSQVAQRIDRQRASQPAHGLVQVKQELRPGGCAVRGDGAQVAIPVWTRLRTVDEKQQRRHRDQNQNRRDEKKQAPTAGSLLRRAIDSHLWSTLQHEQGLNCNCILPAVKG